MTSWDEKELCHTPDDLRQLIFWFMRFVWVKSLLKWECERSERSHCDNSRKLWFMIFLHSKAEINFTSFFKGFRNKKWKTTAQFISISTTSISASHHITIPIKKSFCGEEKKLRWGKKKIIQWDDIINEFKLLFHP